MTGRAIELFAGYGGLALAVEDAFDVETVAMSEIEPAVVEILGHRFPDAASLGDVTRVDWHRVNRMFGPVDILAGGFPCQSVSAAGARAGIAEGTRSGLWYQFARAISILRPQLVVIENVRGLLSAKAARPGAEPVDVDPLLEALGENDDAETEADQPGDDLGLEDEDLGEDGGAGPVLLRALGAVLGDLADLGYDAVWQGVRASDVGAPHGRFRVFILAWPAADAEDRIEPGQPSGDGDGGHRSPGALVGSRIGAGGRTLDRGTAAGVRVAGRVEGPVPAADADPDGLGPVRAGGSRGRGPGSADRGVVAADAPGDRWDEGRPEPAGLVGGPDAPVGGDALADPDDAGCGEHRRPVAVREEHAAAERCRAATAPDPDGEQPERGRGPGFLGGAAATEPREGDQRERAGDTSRGSGPATADPDSDGLPRLRGGQPFGRHVDGRRGPDRPGPATEPASCGCAAWGQYAPAIHRWELILGRPAPAPTEPGKNGPRLSPRAVEFMMGLPAGWVCDVAGVTRNDKLKALGNGVVRQQATAALRRLSTFHPSARHRMPSAV